VETSFLVFPNLALALGGVKELDGYAFGYFCYFKMDKNDNFLK